MNEQKVFYTIWDTDGSPVTLSHFTIFEEVRRHRARMVVFVIGEDFRSTEIKFTTNHYSSSLVNFVNVTSEPNNLTFEQIIEEGSQYDLSVMEDLHFKTLLDKEVPVGMNQLINFLLFSLYTQALETKVWFVLNKDFSYVDALRKRLNQTLTFNIRSFAALPTINSKPEKTTVMNSYEEGAIYLTDSSDDIYGKILSIHDGVIDGFLNCLSTEVQNQVRAINHPKGKKSFIAIYIINTLFGDNEGQKAANRFDIRHRSNLEDLEQVTSSLMLEDFLVKGEVKLYSLMKECKVCNSTKQARAIIYQGSVTIDGEVADVTTTLTSQDLGKVLRMSKRHIYRLV